MSLAEIGQGHGIDRGACGPAQHLLDAATVLEGDMLHDVGHRRCLNRLLHGEDFRFEGSDAGAEILDRGAELLFRRVRAAGSKRGEPEPYENSDDPGICCHGWFMVAVAALLQRAELLRDDIEKKPQSGRMSARERRRHRLRAMLPLRSRE